MLTTVPTEGSVEISGASAVTVICSFTDATRNVTLCVRSVATLSTTFFALTVLNPERSTTTVYVPTGTLGNR